eukprot:501185_1
MSNPSVPTLNPWLNNASSDSKLQATNVATEDKKEKELKKQTNNTQDDHKKEAMEQGKEQNKLNKAKDNQHESIEQGKQNKDQQNKGKKRKNQRKKNKKNRRNKRRQANKPNHPPAYPFRNRKPKKTQSNVAHYDTDEELNKLHNDTDDDCDLNQDEIPTQTPKKDDSIQDQTETKQPETPNDDSKSPSESQNTDNTDSKPKQESISLQVDAQWDYDELMDNKQLVLGCKYKWNFCSSYFSTQTLEHIYDAAFPTPSPTQSATYDAMLKESIHDVTKYHRKTMEDALRIQFENFADNYCIQFSDSILMFNGIEGKNHMKKGRSVRVGFFPRNDSNNNKKQGKLEMLVCYADNKQFIAESQQFLGLKIGKGEIADFRYESRRWALAEDAAFTEMHGTAPTGEKWMDIALVVGVAIVNRLLNPSLPEPHRMNSIYKQEHVDITELLPPFDGLESLVKNDGLWWIEVEKRIHVPKGFDVDDGSSLEGSLKDFIDDSVVEAPVNISNLMNDNFNNAKQGEGGGMLNDYLMSLKQYNESMDKTYEMGEEEEDDDYAQFIDETIAEDVKNLLDNSLDESLDANETTSDIKKESTGDSDTEKVNRKRDIKEMEKGEAESNIKNEDHTDEPPAKKQKV